jgi:outer membrane immunogenic protein
MRNVLLATAALTLISAPAMAQSISNPQYQGSIGYTGIDADGATLGAITARGGAKLSRYFGAEAELSVGVKDDDVNFGAIPGKVEHRYDAAAYGVATLPVTENFELFGRLGYGTTELKTSAAGLSGSNSTESVNYGAGANYFFDGQNGVRADWTRRDFRGRDGIEADTWGLGYVRRF